MATSKHYLNQLKNALAERNKFNESVQSQKLANIGVYQKATEEQKPIIEKLEEQRKDVVNQITKLVEKQSESTEKQPTLENITKKTSGESYSLVPTGDTIELPSINTEFDEWKFKSSAKSNMGQFILMRKNGVNIIWGGRVENVELELTPGLEEILFNDATNLKIINDEDITNWKTLIEQAGLGSLYHKSKIYKRLDKHSGDGVAPSEVATPVPYITIPSDPNELREELAIQIAAMQNGHKNTFQTANTIMHELLKQKQFTSKEYLDILKNIYRV